jgi:ParB family chromosome partitioning protein
MTDMTILPLDQIDADPDQPRKHFDDQALAELAASLGSVGLLEPVIVRPVGGRHFVPVGWEETDRGLCPCGEAVRWDPSLERWVPDRTLVVLVLTEAEYQHLRDDALMVEDLEPELDLQFGLNRWPDDIAEQVPA